MKYLIRLTFVALVQLVISSQPPQLQGNELKACFQYQCLPFVRKLSFNFEEAIEVDLAHLNKCESSRDYCYANEWETSSDNLKLQSCYDECYNPQNYQNELFKYYLQCAWQCGSDLYKINNNFYFFDTSSPAFLLSLGILGIASLILIVRTIQIKSSG